VRGDLRVLHVDPAMEIGDQYCVDHERQTLSVRVQDPPNIRK
jgi:hypothetical protein